MICVDCANGSCVLCANFYRELTDQELDIVGSSAVMSSYRGSLVRRDLDAKYNFNGLWCDCQNKPRIKEQPDTVKNYSQFTYDHKTGKTYDNLKELVEMNV